MHSRIEQNIVKVGGHPISMEAGTCSNPDPLPEILKLPLSHIDYAWYFLAEAEITAGCDVGMFTKLNGRLTEGVIPTMELSLRMKIIQSDIDKLDAVGFTAHLTKFVETAVYVRKNSSHLRTTFDPLAPEKERIPTLDINAPFDPVVEQVAKDAILAYGVFSSLANRPEAIPELETASNNHFKGPYPGICVFDHWNEKSTLSIEMEKIVVDIIKTLFRNEHLTPDKIWLVGLRFFEWVNQSNFKQFLAAPLAAWQRSGWQRISTEESFRLSTPRKSVPSIKEVLAIPTDDIRFVAKLLLETSKAVGYSLKPEIHNVLKAVAEEVD